MTPIMHKAVRSFSIVLALTLSHPAFAGLDVPYPSGVERLFTEQTENGTLRVPIGPWSQQSSVPHEKRSGTATVSTFELRATSITPTGWPPFVKRYGMQNSKSPWTACQMNAADLIIV